MTTKWCYNAKTGEIFDYEESGGWNNFPRGTFLVYGDYLTTGIKTEEAAQQWATEWHACPKCKSTRHGAVGEPCGFCGAPLIAPAR